VRVHLNSIWPGLFPSPQIRSDHRCKLVTDLYIHSTLT
jgi:hypothetical protein